MKNIKNIILKNKRISLIVFVIILLLLLTSSVTIINRIVENAKKEEIVELEYDTYELSGKKGKALVTFRNEVGISELHYPKETDEEGTIVYSKGKTNISIDYEMLDRTSYEFEAVLKNGSKKTYIVEYEIPRIKGNYELKNDIYVNEPDVSTGFVKEKTRYMYLDDSANLVPGNWITDDEPENWYDYKDQKWANIFVEDSGICTYYVWIPRYMYKVNSDSSTSENERMDVIFVNTYDEYVNSTSGKVSTYEELVADGYQLPEAFTWKHKQTDADLIIPGYWITKYQLSNSGAYSINYNLTASKTTFDVKNFTNNVTATAIKYTYAINGQIVNTSTTLDEYSFINTTPDGNNTINVTALDANGEIVGSMTKQLELVEVNPPDLTGFDPNTTFYVYWDENENEHNEIPISMDPPTDWYNYSYASWANIVTRNDGMETYYTWIPRYAYSLDQTSQRSNIKFIQGVGTEVEPEYAIPEAFTWNGNEITGYWITKYQLTTEASNPKVDVEIGTSSATITINEITGTVINKVETDGTTVNYEYYINGRELITSQDGDYMPYTFGGVRTGYTYIVNVILRNADTNEYLGAVTKKVLIAEPNKPDLTGFEESQTYYVEYEMDDTGDFTELVGQNIKNDGSNIPENWYSYSDRVWANIVVTDGTVTDGVITGATYTTYYTWVPRYEYRILTDRGNLSTSNRRTEVNFLSGTSTEVSEGYQIPEAFTWNGQEMPGYWITKYQLSN